MQKCHPPSPSSSASRSDSVTELSASGESCRLKLRLQTMDALLDVLTTVSRLGASVVSLDAAGNQVDLTATGRAYVIRRLPSLLNQLVMVTELQETLNRADW